MKPEEWHRIEELFHAAMELGSDERGAYLEQACREDLRLRRHVEALINSSEQKDGFLDDEVVDEALRVIAADTQAEEARKTHPASSEPGYAKSHIYIGETFSGRYLISEELGRGGFGIVFLARDLQLLSKPVVVKVLLDDLASPDDWQWFRKKFRQEIQALARIDHPGVVGVLDAGETPDGKPFFVMQYVEGITLRSLLRTEGMEFGRVAEIIRQICLALGAAHEKGIYHRDLKPENVMLQTRSDCEEYVKLIDFGMATVKDTQVNTSSDNTRVAGTIRYMAPEQLMGKPVAASDIYSVGVIAYEMLTGKRPFNPTSPFELLELQRAGVKINPIDLRPTLPEAAQKAMLKALSFAPEDRYKRVRDFSDDLCGGLWAGDVNRIGRSSGNAIKILDGVFSEEERVLSGEATEVMLDKGGTRVVLLYKRKAEPDERLLKLLEGQFSAHGYKVFIDRHMSIGVEWAREIERRIRTAHVVVVLLSAASVTSEMLSYEVQVAHDAAQRQGKPRILPVRVNFEGALPDNLAAILGRLHYALWREPKDDQRLVEDLLSALNTPPESVTSPARLEPVGGAVPLDSEFYIVRPTDEELRTAIARRDSIVLIKGARQMGKTSLLARGLQQARQAGSRVVLTDFQTLNSAHLQSADTLLLTLAETIADQLDLDTSPEESWSAKRGPSMNFSRFLRREVLSNVSSHLVWGLDEVDRLFSCPYGSEVFGLFRSWHNARSLEPEGPWQRLTLAIAYATEAHLFITDVNQSPFNVGTRLALDDFTYDQVEELNRRYDSPLKGGAEVARFFRLLGGHPYLVRRGLHEMATHKFSLTAFESQADRDEGPFGDHLRRILVLLAQDHALMDAIRAVLRGQTCPTMESFYRLRSAGVVSGDSARDARPRCQLYANYLERHLLS